MYKTYKTLSIILSPLIKCYFYLRCLFDKDETSSVKNHFGYATIERPEGKVIWMHAASIGESLSALTYIRHFKELHPDTSVLLTTITLTSANLLRQKLSSIPGCYHQFVVADVPSWINKFLDYWKPEKVVFFESEIWPNILQELNQRNISTYLVNARLSDRSFSRWKMFRQSMKNLLSKFEKILAQSQLDAEKFASFGSENIIQMDNLKYANGKLPCNNNLLNVFKSFCSGRNVFVAASTHEGEEAIILNAHKIILLKTPITTIIAPRHIQRVKQICNLCDQMNLSYTLRSEATSGHLSNSDIFIIDTYGELGTFFTLAQVAFVGGSLIPGIGGHNIIEPIESGKPVLHGPYMDNCNEIKNTLQDLSVAYEVKTEKDIADICVNLFGDSNLLKKIKEISETKSQNHSLEQIDEWIK